MHHLPAPSPSSAMFFAKKRRTCPLCVFFGLLVLGAAILGVVLVVKKFTH